MTVVRMNQLAGHPQFCCSFGVFFLFWGGGKFELLQGMFWSCFPSTCVFLANVLPPPLHPVLDFRRPFNYGSRDDRLCLLLSS